MQASLQKQREFELGKIKLSSKFESGNLKSATMNEPNQINLWIGNDPNSNYKTWFYFSVENVSTGTTVTFTIMNMSNQVKLFKEGHLPVFRTEKTQEWARIKQPIQSNAVVKTEEGFKVTFKHLFANSSKHYFAFTYPWTVKENETLIEELIHERKNKIFCFYETLAKTSNNRKVMLLTLTKKLPSTKIEFTKFNNLQQEVCVFPQKPGIFISARVHPGEVAASHIMNGILKTLFSDQAEAALLLENFVFYIVPIINPDGVSEGNFRTDSKGNNLNRYYSNPSIFDQPQIFMIKEFLVQMIKIKRIGFCLDLHAHVNKTGAFIYGNCITNLKGQMQVCLFPKLLSYHSEYFDYESCNFSEKNMSSKDKGDELSKEGASRVAIFKETGLVECWTLQCNYNSAKIINMLPKKTVQSKMNNVTNTVMTGQVGPEQKEEVRYFNIPEFQKIGHSIVDTIIDYYELRENSPVFSSKLKSLENLKINVAISSLRMLPYRFDADLRKVLNNINSQVKLHDAIAQVSNIIFSSKIKKSNNKTLFSQIKQKVSQKHIKVQEKQKKIVKIPEMKVVSNKMLSFTASMNENRSVSRKYTIKK